MPTMRPRRSMDQPFPTKGTPPSVAADGAARTDAIGGAMRVVVQRVLEAEVAVDGVIDRSHRARPGAAGGPRHRRRRATKWCGWRGRSPASASSTMRPSERASSKRCASARDFAVHRRRRLSQGPPALVRPCDAVGRCLRRFSSASSAELRADVGPVATGRFGADDAGAAGERRALHAGPRLGSVRCTTGCRRSQNSTASPFTA